MKSYILPTAILLCILLFMLADWQARRSKPPIIKLFTYNYTYEG